jgi:pilus assembly protein CpaB
MNKKTWLPAILAVVLGGAAAFMVRNSMMKNKPTPVVATPKMVPAVVATGDLIAGQELASENMSIITVASTTPDIVGNPVELIGRVMSSPVRKGEAIHQANLAPRGALATLPSLIPAGMRAITISVDEPNSFSGMLTPGCHVDIYSTIAAGKDSINRQLVKDILVQAVGARLTSGRSEDGKDPAPYHTATLIVTPREAQLIDFAVASTRLRVVLRPLSHSATPEDGGDGMLTMDDVSGRDSRSQIVPVAHAPTTQSSQQVMVVRTPTRDVTLILGTKSTVQKVDDIALKTVEDADIDKQRDRILDGVEPIQN